MAETRYHRERFLRATQEPSLELTLRAYVCQVVKALDDILMLDTQQLRAMGRNAQVRVVERHSIDTEATKLASPAFSTLSNKRPPSILIEY